MHHCASSAKRKDVQSCFIRAVKIIIQTFFTQAHGLESIEYSVTLNNLGVLSAHLHRLPLAPSLLQRAYAISHLTICAKKISIT